MPDITQQDPVMSVERRLDGRPQGGGHAGGSDQPAKKVTASYEEVAKTQPTDDRITILGIPVEQITPATQAALGGLVAEINYLRGVVKRQDRSGARKSEASTAVIVDPDSLMKALGGALAAPPPAEHAWALLLVHVPTYEDIRRSSGLLAANGVLADVAQRLREFRMDIGAPASPFSLLGYAGGSNLAALTALTADQPGEGVARNVRAQLSASGYLVSGIEMSLVIRTAVAAIGAGESATLALGRADHLLRTG